MTYQAFKVILGDPPLVIMLPTGTAAAVLVSWLVFVSIEQPMIRVGKRRLAARKARRAAASINGTACRIMPALRQASGGAAR